MFGINSLDISRSPALYGIIFLSMYRGFSLPLAGIQGEGIFFCNLFFIYFVIENVEISFDYLPLSVTGQEGGFLFIRTGDVSCAFIPLINCNASD
jgi:uncharacterized membrane protein YobD (UPF0266 family)